jgi:hypothetical protein
MSSDLELSPVSKEALIMLINYHLRKDWTYDDYENGKPIDLQWSWGASLKNVLYIYRDKGWEIQKLAVFNGNDRKLQLRFKNSQWQLHEKDFIA